MDNHLETEQRKYDWVWTNPQYAVNSPGLRILTSSLEWLNPEPNSSICDFGSGSGQAAQAMADMGYAVTGFDLCAHANQFFDGEVVIGTLWDMPHFGIFEYGYCTDVLEHIPPSKICGVLSGIRERVTQGCFFQIARFEDHFGDEEHGQLHICLRPPKWWRASFELAGWEDVEFKVSDKYILVRAMK